MDAAEDVVTLYSGPFCSSSICSHREPCTEQRSRMSFATFLSTWNTSLRTWGTRGVEGEKRFRRRCRGWQAGTAAQQLSCFPMRRHFQLACVSLLPGSARSQQRDRRIV